MKKIILLLSPALFAKNLKEIQFESLRNCHQESISTARFFCGFFGRKDCKEKKFKIYYENCVDFNEKILDHNLSLKKKYDFDMDQILPYIEPVLRALKES